MGKWVIKMGYNLEPFNTSRLSWTEQLFKMRKVKSNQNKYFKIGIFEQFFEKILLLLLSNIVSSCSADQAKE